jgi:hypothetical protein
MDVADARGAVGFPFPPVARQDVATAVLRATRGVEIGRHRNALRFAEGDRDEVAMTMDLTV